MHRNRRTVHTNNNSRSKYSINSQAQKPQTYYIILYQLNDDDDDDDDRHRLHIDSSTNIARSKKLTTHER